jgi:hypothetical protein
LFTFRDNLSIKQPVGEAGFDECAGGILSGSGDRMGTERPVPHHCAVAGLAVSAPSGIGD